MKESSVSLAEMTYYTEAFSRNIGLITPEEQETLRNTTVAVAGLGGVGGIFALSLARLGIGGFHLCDPDTFATVNVNRQIGALASTLGKPKSDVMAAMIRDINPFARVKIFNPEDEVSGVFFAGAHIAVDGIDFFTIGPRRKFYKKARENGLTVVSAGPIGFGSSLNVFQPKGMSFDEYFDVNDNMPHEEMVLHFGLGIAPALLQRAYFRPTKVDFKVQTAPSLVTGTLLAANLVTCEVIKILLKRGNVTYMPHSLQFDPYAQKFTKVFLRHGNRSLSQRLKLWYVKRLLKQQNKL